MQTVNSKIQLDTSQFDALVQESQRRQISIEELVRHLVMQYLAELALSQPQDQARFESIVGLGKSGMNNISKKHDQYLGEMIAHV